MFRRGGWYNGPKSVPAGLAALPPLIALIFACGAWEMLTNMERSPNIVLLGMLVGGVVGIAAGLILLWMLVMYLEEKPKAELDPSEEGTATDPKLYNLPDDDL